MAGDAPRGSAGEEEGDGGHFVRLNQAALRVGFFEEGTGLFGSHACAGDHVRNGGIGHGSIYITGADGVDGDVRGQFDGEGAGQAEDAMFAGGVRGNVFGPHFAGNGGNVDDPPPLLLDHLRDEGFGDVVDAVQIDIEDSVPEFVRVVEEFVAVGDARVVDEDVHAAPLIEEGGAHGGDLSEVGYIAGEGEGLSAVRGDFVCDSLGVGEGAGGEGDSRACLGKREGNCAANAFTAAGDEGAFVGEGGERHVIYTEIHRVYTEIHRDFLQNSLCISVDSL